MRTQVAAFAAISLSTVNLLGQPTPSPNSAWTQATAIDHALEQNADLRVARISIAIAEARLEKTGLRENPELELDYASDFAFNNEGEHNFSVAIAQRFPLANRLKKAKAVSQVDIAKAKMEVRQHERAIANTISEIALEIQIVDTRKDLLERLRDQTWETEGFLRSRAERGEISILEVNQITLEARGLDIELTQLSNERAQLAQSLIPHLGLTPGTPLEFAPSKSIEIEAALPGIDFSLFERHPEFQLAVLDSLSAEAEIALAESENWESVTARLFWEDERSMDEPVGLGTDRFVGAGLSIPLPLKKRGQLLAREHHIARDRSHLKAAAIKLQVESDIDNARQEAANLASQLEDYRENILQLARTQLDETQSAYQKGQLSFISLFRAQEQILRLERNYIEMQSAYARARLKLKLARIDIPQLQPSIQQ